MSDSKSYKKDEPLLDNERYTTNSLELSNPEHRKWIPYAITAAILFTICNSAFTEVSQLGIEGLFYISPGGLLCAIVFFGIKMIQEYRNTGILWTDLNFTNKQTKQIDWKNVLGFTLFATTYLSYQSLVLITFSYCILAGLNAGIVSVIWSTTPLYGAILDYLIFGQKLYPRHIIGVICLIFCACSISLSGVLYANNQSTIDIDKPFVQPWVPVLIAITIPLFFAVNSIQVKYLVKIRHFDAFKLSFGSYGIVGLGLFCILITKLQDPSFSKELLGIGTAGSIINTIGIVMAVKATSIGPIGPASALTGASTIMFSIVQAVRYLKSPTLLEIIGMIIGIIGALVLTIPEQLNKLVNYVTCRSNMK